MPHLVLTADRDNPNSLSVILSAMSQSSSRAENPGHSLQNGQKLPTVPAKTSTPLKKQPEISADCGKPSRPAGERRCVSVCERL